MEANYPRATKLFGNIFAAILIAVMILSILISLFKLLFRDGRGLGLYGSHGNSYFYSDY